MKKEYLKPIVLTNSSGSLLVPALVAAAVALAGAAGAAVGVKAVNAMFEENMVEAPNRRLEPIY
ncbi:hypothetical protein AGMMS50276_00470 [Synergistales bacterium]|nr:hypothetical protein AGMMS50276_00470 [Synergistales bacterium]